MFDNSILAVVQIQIYFVAIFQQRVRDQVYLFISNSILDFASLA